MKKQTKEMESSTGASMADAWVFVIAGALAMLATPHLVEIAGGAHAFLMVAAFVGLVGACDASRAQSDVEAAIRTTSWLATGVVVGVAMLFSGVAAAVLFGFALVANRWYWLEPKFRSETWIIPALAIAAVGMWAVPPALHLPESAGLSYYFPTVVWGFCGGLAALTLQMPRFLAAESSAEGEEIVAGLDSEEQPEPGDMDGRVGGKIQKFPDGRSCG